jgi:SAM-dependent methyltransferase
MAAEPHGAAEFYGTTHGTVAGRLLRERLRLLWPDVRGQSVLGCGHATPYLRLWREQAGRCIAVTPASRAVARWPAGAPNLTCAAEEQALPFPDLFFDRILLVHALETADNARGFLREIWRVLRDDGTLLVVAPNRRGLWAHAENTPFGHGEPFSAGQIGRLLTASLFRVERRDAALFIPPTHMRLVLRGASLIERVGHRVAPRFAGVTITEAVKDLYGAVPADAVPRRRHVFAEAA